MSDPTKLQPVIDAAESDASLLLRLIAASPAVLYSCRVTEDCGTIAVTGNVRSLLGYAPEDFIADPSFWALRIHPEDCARVFAEMPRLFREGEETIEYRFRHSDGTYRWLRDTMRLESDADGRPVRILGCWVDVTEEKQAVVIPRLILSGTPVTTTTTLGGSYAKRT
jgi:PAS domain S-box-containing protein